MGHLLNKEEYEYIEVPQRKAPVLTKRSDNDMMRNQQKITDFVCGYFRQLEADTTCILMQEIRQIIMNFCSFEYRMTLIIWDTVGQVNISKYITLSVES